MYDGDSTVSRLKFWRSGICAVASGLITIAIHESDSEFVEVSSFPSPNNTVKTMATEANDAWHPRKEDHLQGAHNFFGSKQIRS